MTSPRPGKVLRLVLRVPTHLYRWRLGWLLGHRFLLLHHTGRRTGRPHTTVLEVVRYSASSAESVVVSGWGANADWFKNVQAHTPTAVTIGRQTYPVEAHVLDVDEAASVLADYERRNRLARPIVRKVLSTLAGEPYDGSSASRRRLVERLPLVALRGERD